jgi:mRNA-degrading endonuclease RelE of RelBE toxin-antitoxin system
MSFRLTFGPTADQSFPRLPPPVRERFNRAFDTLEQDPRRGSAALDIHQLYGYKNVWTLRIPPYRGVYAIDGNDVVMVIFGHRDTVYQDLHRLLPPRRRMVTAANLGRRPKN